jgi:hypothetical protein
VFIVDEMISRFSWQKNIKCLPAIGSGRIYGVGSYDPSKAPVMAFYKDNSETSASLKNGEFLVSWVTISV